ncbi:hypothetical protein L226DRAFT_151624 [Lentinus tigrinus ALCF2SS1-7]|uniref:Uncharacterized protein n=1 Tax=Lentinus tigrinus ALCF2SS1-6 TaxID=1328759 RepID=A0A5C2RPA0_9APHY|nr:hypothetical protein L227DRAFT_398155 [Lentinus tigrinus ALCF2SS1-6]RPD72667.1 hypothetical protein L226DRAFT_151624 [Lentinus tigrinus ALCF2SS1-7]
MRVRAAPCPHAVSRPLHVFPFLPAQHVAVRCFTRHLPAQPRPAHPVAFCVRTVLFFSFLHARMLGHPVRGTLYAPAGTHPHVLFRFLFPIPMYVLLVLLFSLCCVQLRSSPRLDKSRVSNHESRPVFWRYILPYTYPIVSLCLYLPASTPAHSAVVFLLLPHHCFDPPVFFSWSFH